MDEDNNGRQRIAVIGGGVGAITTIFALTREPDWRERYEFDIYQLGWRLGGKGASGRNTAEHERIQEHGLHVWLGFYENAFHCMRACYEELGRDPNAPLATWEQAFHKHSKVVFEEHLNGQWSPWVVDFPSNDAVPGDGGILPSVADYLNMVLQWAHDTLHHPSHQQPLLTKVKGEAESLPPWIDDLERKAEGPTPAHPALTPVAVALGLAHKLATGVETRVSDDLENIVALVDHFGHWLEQRLEELLHDHALRHLYIGVNLALAVAKGLVRDGVIKQGNFNVINQYDFRQWLIRNGANEQVTAWSAPIQAVYDLVFAYADGDTSDPQKANLEAGTGLRGVLRMLFTYKGAYCWMMQAGMGDTVFAPYYQVLSSPAYSDNVRFHFFHHVLSLDSDDGKAITRITVDPQVRLREPDSAYQPLVDVKGLPCWPSEPLYDQLNPEDAQALQAGNIDLESWWSPWRESEKQRSVELQLGRDYDQVLLGIPPSAAQHLFGQAIRQLPQWPRWQGMIEQVRTVQTQAIQLWTKPALPALGWRLGPPLLGGFTEPLSTWAAMGHLIPREAWPAEDSPASLAYFTGPFRDAEAIPQAPDDQFPVSQLDRVKRTGETFFGENIASLWPDSVGGDGQFPPGLVQSEYWRCNIDPTERYVQSVVNSSQYRLAVDGSGFDNLFLSGDWVRNHLNAGCVEAATIGGLRAARAIAGGGIAIIGEDTESGEGDPT